MIYCGGGGGGWLPSGCAILQNTQAEIKKLPTKYRLYLADAKTCSKHPKMCYYMKRIIYMKAFRKDPFKKVLQIGNFLPWKKS